jgi:ribose transport system substrate-binding protein
MRKLVLLVLAVMLVGSLSVFAAGGQEDAGAKEGDYVIGISNSLYGNLWREKMLEDMATVADFYIAKGMLKGTVVQQSGPDVQTQIQQIRNMINQGVDLICINPASASGLVGVIEEAKDVGIASIVFDAELVGKERELALSVVSDKYVEMYGATKYVLEKLGGKGDVVVMLGNAAYQPTQKRHEGVKGALKEFPNVRVLTTVYGEWNQATAEAVMNDVVAAYPKIDAVITVGSMGMGALRAFQNAGRPLPAITGDPTVEFIRFCDQQIKAGKKLIFAAPANPPGIGGTALAIGVYMLNGYEFKDGVLDNNTYFYPVETLVTPENLAKFIKEFEGADPATWISEYASDEQVRKLFK